MIEPAVILRSEHQRILAGCQARYDAGFKVAYERGRWDGLALGMCIGTLIGIVFMIGLYMLATGQVK